MARKVKEAKDLKEVLNNWGFAFELLKVLVHAILQKGGTMEHLKRLIKEADLAGKVADLLVAGTVVVQSAVEAAVQTYDLAVDYSQTLTQMIEAGRYGWKNSDITAERFPVVGTGKAAVKAVLVHLNKVASTDEVLAYLDQNGLRPATLAELLAFGAKFPDIQRRFPVVELGSLWVCPVGDRCAACLVEDAGGRGLRLDWFDGVWFKSCCFLAVSK